MLLLLEDDGLVRVYDSSADVEKTVEGLDIEVVLKEAFDDAGRRLRVQWLEPNTEFRGLLLTSVGSGRYALVPDGPPDLEAFERFLRSSTHPLPKPAAELLANLVGRA